MTFITLISPKGGMMLKHLIKYPFSREANVKMEPQNEPVIMGDYICLQLGYCYRDLKKGEPIYIKPSDGEELYKLLKRHLDK